MPAVLEGVRVVDFGHHVAGPLAAVLLGDQGADVVRVDRPGTADTEADAYLQRGKRRITLDLKDPADLAVARGLVAGADVLIENFRPGVMDRLGLGADELRGQQPGLVYCSLPGFGRDDPRRELAGWEGVIAAATGNCRVRIGEVEGDWDFDRPTYTALPLASNFAAILAGYAITAALTRRHRTGQGERIEVPLFDASFELIGGAGAYPLSRGFRRESPLDRRGSGTYRCADGRWVQFNPIGASTRFLSWLFDAAGVPEWVGEGFTSPRALDTDPDVARELRARLRTLFAGRPAAEWERAANAAGVPLCMVRTAEEWLDSEHAVAAGQVADVVDPELGPLRMPASPVTIGGGGAPIAARHVRDADAAELRAAAGRVGAGRLPADANGAAGTEDSLSGQGHSGVAGTSGAPYAGLKVVDLTQILAGPSAGRMLVELGAEVVKINAPQRPVEAHGLVNRGKRTMLLDLEDPRGQEVLWTLIDAADVLTLNYPRATARRYGLGYEHVHARRPDLVYVAVSCYGYDGPWESYRGYEVQGQAVAGIMDRTGGDGKPGVLGPYNVLDYGTGAMAAFAAALGVYHQAVTGEGLLISASLAQTGAFHQATLQQRYAGKRWDEPRGPGALGAGVLRRFYRASDEWFFLGAPAAELDRIAAIAGVPAGPAPDSTPAGPADSTPAGPADSTLADALATAFATESVAHWSARLTGGAVTVQRVVHLDELLFDPVVVERGLSVVQVSDEAGEVVLPGVALRFDGVEVRPGPPVRRPGSDALEVLAGVGLAERAPELDRAWVLQLADLPRGWDLP